MTQLFRLPKQYYYDVWFAHTQNNLTMRTQQVLRRRLSFLIFCQPKYEVFKL